MFIKSIAFIMKINQFVNGIKYAWDNKRKNMKKKVKTMQTLVCIIRENLTFFFAAAQNNLFLS